MILNDKTIHNLTDDDHYRNLLKILNWNGYSQWDEYHQEKVHYLHMYKEFVIEKNSWRNVPISSNFDSFCQEVL